MVQSDDEPYAEIQKKAEELHRLLDDFSDRLRRMRQRNRQVEEEIVGFERELERMRGSVAKK